MRRAHLSLTYQGKDITKDIGPDLISFSFTDKDGGEADDVQIKLSDRDRNWQGPWLPTHGDKMVPVIHCENWFADGDAYALPCGGFQVDELELESGEIDTMTIKGIPAAVKSSITGQTKTKAWQGTTLQQVAGDVAASAGLELVYKAETVTLRRIDQRQETDLAFLTRIAEDFGCHVKAHDEKIVIFSGKLADAQSAIKLTRADGASFRGKKTVADTYQGSRISYTDPATGKTHKAVFAPDDAPKTGKYQEINARVDDLGQAHKVAPSALRSKNKKANSSEWEGMGDPRIRAGMNVEIEGFGAFDGKYHVREAEHTLDMSGYRTRLSLEKTLGY